jgi:hypothetical protein
MPVFHTIGSQGNNNRDLRLKLLDLDSDDFCNFEDIGKLFVSEVSQYLSHDLRRVVDTVFNLLGIDFIEWVIKPGGMTLFPSFDDCPEIIVWLELFLHCLNSAVVSNVLVLDQGLSVVDHLSMLVGLIDPLLYVLGHLSDFFEGLGISVLLESRGKVF